MTIIMIGMVLQSSRALVSLYEFLPGQSRAKTLCQGQLSLFSSSHSLSFKHLSNCIFPCPLLFLAVYALHAGYLFVADKEGNCRVLLFQSRKTTAQSMTGQSALELQISTHCLLESLQLEPDFNQSKASHTHFIINANQFGYRSTGDIG